MQRAGPALLPRRPGRHCALLAACTLCSTWLLLWLLRSPPRRCFAGCTTAAAAPAINGDRDDADENGNDDDAGSRCQTGSSTQMQTQPTMATTSSGATAAAVRQRRQPPRIVDVGC